MKKQFFRTASLCRNAGKLALATCIMTASFSAGAQTTQVKQEIKAAAAAPVSVKYLGSHDDYLSFLVKYDNVAGDRFDVSLREHDGSVLYKGVFTDKNFQKTFVIPKPDRGTVTFIIRNLRTNEVNSFEANTKLVEEMVVKQVG